MEQNDLKQIREEIGSVIEDNIIPVLDGMKSEIGGIKSEIGGIKSEISGIKSEISWIKSQMVTKAYLDDKLADLEGATVVRQRKEDQKVNLLISMLREGGTITDTQTEQLKEIKIFPV